MKRLAGLSIVSLVLSAFALGCGDSGSDPTTQNANTTATDTTAQSTEASAPSVEAESTMEATCVLRGKREAQITLSYTDDGFDLAFKGQPVPTKGTALYSATVFDMTGEYGSQLGMKFLNGKQIAYFVFSMDTYEQANLDGTAIVNGDTVSGTFPADDLGQLAEAGPASWSAALNIEGRDVGECPSGIDSLPFPD